MTMWGLCCIYNIQLLFSYMHPRFYYHICICLRLTCFSMSQD